MSLDRRARRVSEATGIRYARALDICRQNEGLKSTVNRHSSNKEVVQAFHREGLSHLLPVIDDPREQTP
jgi:hypothetical protein